VDEIEALCSAEPERWTAYTLAEMAILCGTSHQMRAFEDVFWTIGIAIRSAAHGSMSG